MEAKRLDDISILRVLCIIIVVFFHCYGMMYAKSHFPATVSIYESLYFIPNQCVFINLAMPLFVVVSGFLFEFLLGLGKYSTWSVLFRKKGLRIILPYLVFGLFFMATTSDWHPLKLLNGGYWYLWFLPMLFWCFVLGYGVYKLKISVNVGLFLLLISLLGVIFPKFIPMWFGLHNITRWFYWFYLGMILCKYKEIISAKIAKYRLHIPLLVCYLFVTFFYPIEYGNDTWYSVIGTTCCIILINDLMKKVAWDRYKVVDVVAKFSAYSFGIYIWHNWVALMLVSNTSKRLLGLETLAANHVILFPLCFSLITLAISWFLSWCMMKTKVGRFLIG